MGPASTGDLLLTEHRDPDPWGHEAAVDPGGDHRRSPGLQRRETVQGKTLLGEGPGHPVGGSFAVHRHHHVDPLAQEAVYPRSNGSGITGHRIEGPDLEHHVVGPGGRGRELQVPPSIQTRLEIEEQRRMLTRLRGLLAPCGSQGRRQLGLLLDQVARPIEGTRRVDHHEIRLRRQDIDQRLRLGEPGQPGLDAGEEQALGDAVPGGCGPRLRRDQSMRLLADDRARPHLAGRIGDEGGDGVLRALAGHREGPHLIQLIAPEVEPHRDIVLSREHVHDAAPDRELPSGLDPIGRGVPEIGQLARQFAQRRLLTRPQ